MVPIDFQNVGSAPCRMFGYPGVAGLNRSGEQVAQATPNVQGTAPSVVVLGSMQSASAEVDTDEVPTDLYPCLVLPALLVTPPDDSYSTRAIVGTQGDGANEIHACQPLSVGPVVLGASDPFGGNQNPAALVPALQTHDPMVIVSPSTNLANGEKVEVRVTGFGVGGKVWLSECADATEANDLGCGPGLPAQTLLVTDNTGSGSMAFQVQSSAAPKANDYGMTDLQPCANKCVLVVSLGGGYDFAYASLQFVDER